MRGFKKHHFAMGSIATKIASLTLSLAVAYGPGAKADDGYSPELCQDLLTTTETLRCFRSKGDHTTQNGCYAFGDSRESAYYRSYNNPRRPEDWPNSPNRDWRETNVTSHMNILRKMMGQERFAEVVRTRDRSKLDQVLDEELSKSQSKEDQLDAEELLAITERFSLNEPLPLEIEEIVFKLFKQMGRLASPMANWLKPKLNNQLLSQLPPYLIEDSIEREVRDDVLVYKAVLVKLRLHETREFIMSGSASGLPDQVHDLIVRSVTMAVPRGRLESATSGYLVIRFLNAEKTKGTIEFITKGQNKQVLAREDF